MVKDDLLVNWLRHVYCGTRVQSEIRRVIAEPNDAHWPKDAYVALPWCPRCREIVNLGSLMEVEKSER